MAMLLIYGVLVIAGAICIILMFIDVASSGNIYMTEERKRRIEKIRIIDCD